MLLLIDADSNTNFSPHAFLRLFEEHFRYKLCQKNLQQTEALNANELVKNMDFV